MSVPLKDSTIPHTVSAKFGGTKVLLKPARVGTGVIAGGTIRVIADLAGISDLVAKTHGSTNKVNNAKATLKALGLTLDKKKK